MMINLIFFPPLWRQQESGRGTFKFKKVINLIIEIQNDSLQIGFASVCVCVSNKNKSFAQIGENAK